MTQTFGIGVWRTRDGRKAVVDRDDGSDCWPLCGPALIGSGAEMWARDGNWGDGKESRLDLVGPWIEPSADEAESAQPLAPERTLRDEFAMAALQGICCFNGTEGMGNGPGSIADRAYEIADAMMVARGQAV